MRGENKQLCIMVKKERDDIHEGGVGDEEWIWDSTHQYLMPGSYG